MEIILETHPGADTTELRRRLERLGLESTLMRKGLLVAGDIDRIKEVIPGLADGGSSEVVVPDALKDTVRAIYTIKPRSPN